MNNELIKKMIAISNETCPEFVYHNPLLDRNVTNALSKSFIKILKISDQNCTTNNNLRLSILENIRKLCTIEPDGHSQVDDHFTQLLTEIYQDNVISKHEDSVEKKLDAFLVRKLKNLNVNSSSQTTINPEVVQALINMNQTGVHLDTLSRDIIHWNVGCTRYTNVLKELWDHNADTSINLTDDICIKMKPQIEMLLLNFCNKILSTATGDQNIDNLIKSNNDLMELIKKCSISSQCFQMCSGILNFIFIMTNFDTEMQKFIPAFVNHVKVNCHLETPCPLYPLRLSSLVLLLDFDIHILPEPLKSRYIQPTVSYLQKLHRESENDLILLLSHYPQWFDIYFCRPAGE